MARRSKFKKKNISIIFMVIGVSLLFWGYQMSGSIGSELTNVFKGSHPEQVMFRYIGGASSFVGGLYIYMRK